jgi:prepilin-type N-terminal cleavage/methylation domain-containing protein
LHCFTPFLDGGSKTEKVLLLSGMGIDLRKFLGFIPEIGMRSPHHDNLDGQRGVSYVELLIVIVIIAIVVSLALMQRGSANEQFQRQNIARQLKVAFERARFDSVKRRSVGGSAPQAYVTVTPASFTLRTYNTDVNGAAVASDQVTSLPSGIVIGHYDGSALVSHEVDFNMRGETPSSPAPQFFVCNNSCSSPSNATANIVLVTPTGTVNLLPGGSTIPTFTSPTITNVSGGAGINPVIVAP